MLPAAGATDRHRALALATQSGQLEVVKILLDAGEDPNRFNPEGCHSHATPLHQAIAAGHLEMTEFLVARGARLDTKDTIFKGTPLGWAEYLRETRHRRLSAGARRAELTTFALLDYCALKRACRFCASPNRAAKPGSERSQVVSGSLAMYGALKKPPRIDVSR